jgi:hypothetical protein
MKNLSEHDATALIRVVADLFGKISDAPTKRIEDQRKEEFLTKLRTLGLLEKIKPRR